jgi:hypothetical protein
MIELNEFDYPRREYVKMIRPYLLRGCYWGLAYIAFVLSAWLLDFDGGLFMFLFLFVCPFSLYISYTYLNGWFFAASAKDTHFYQKRTMSFDADKFHVQEEDGSESHISLNQILRADCYGNYYRLFLNNYCMLPVPVSAFRSDEDRMRFETEILGDKLKKGLSWAYGVICIVSFTVSILISVGILYVLRMLF